ncbi:MAG TPA: pseudouridine synthase [Dokdonella sp.]|uniref:pseudouridine synthase n=1 Tax=Dokdonella sp. TaxID=2291710 RepID=UPI0025BF3286|nr:pseudouridine synthase [Dokdonella sp.]HNR90974.1 pseudouridine synthase [Dokdonella sp.]
MRVRILHLDDALVVVAKPAGMPVHRSRLVNDDEVYLIDAVRAAVPGPLHLIHRLDRATSGVLLIGRGSEVAAMLGRQFMARDVAKTYLAVCRGWPDEEGVIDSALPGVREHSERKPALTRWRRLATIEVPIAVGRYPQQRYALVEVDPETGRYRQIRRHFSHIRHPLIGDTSHGRTEHNRLFKQYFGVHRLLLHAWKLAFTHPLDGCRLCVEAPLDEAFAGLLARFGWVLPAPREPL